MRRYPSILCVLLPLLIPVIAACDSPDDKAAPPAPPGSVAEIRPCQLLPGTFTFALALGSGETLEEGYRRTCRYVATGTDQALLALDLVVRESTEANTIADAARLADIMRRERDGTGTVRTVNGREVHQVVWTIPGWQPDAPGTPACSYFFALGPTASVEAFAQLYKPDGRCEFEDLLTRLARALPPAAPGQPTPAGDRPVDVLALEPCALVPAERRAALALDGGRPDTVGTVRSCFFYAPNTGAGQVTSVGTAIWTTGAQRLAEAGDDPATTRSVRGRTAYETRKSTGSLATCTYRLEVTRATSVEVHVNTIGADVEPACRVLADLAAAVEPLLPSVAV